MPDHFRKVATYALHHAEFGLNHCAGRERVRKYLEDSVVPTLRKGMRELVRTKPDDPFQFLADYLITNKPSIEG